MDWKSILQSVGIVVKEDIVDYIEQCLRKEVLDAKIIQRENDIIAAIKGVIDLKVSDVEIFELIQKHFEIDSISEIKKYIVEARSSYQCEKLKLYLGISGVEWIKYKREHSVLTKLKSNPELLVMSSEKLKEYIESN